MTLQEALALVASQRVGVLVTLRRDGRPQTSNVVYPDWQEYHRAMVEERRLLLTLTVTSGYGGRAG